MSAEKIDTVEVPIKEWEAIKRVLEAGRELPKRFRFIEQERCAICLSRGPCPRDCLGRKFREALDALPKTL